MVHLKKVERSSYRLKDVVLIAWTPHDFDGLSAGPFDRLCAKLLLRRRVAALGELVVDRDLADVVAVLLAALLFAFVLLGTVHGLGTGVGTFDVSIVLEAFLWHLVSAWEVGQHLDRALKVGHGQVAGFLHVVVAVGAFDRHRHAALAVAVIEVAALLLALVNPAVHGHVADDLAAQLGLVLVALFLVGVTTSVVRVLHRLGADQFVEVLPAGFLSFVTAVRKDVFDFLEALVMPEETLDKTQKCRKFQISPVIDGSAREGARMGFDFAGQQHSALEAAQLRRIVDEIDHLLGGCQLVHGLLVLRALDPDGGPDAPGGLHLLNDVGPVVGFGRLLIDEQLPVADKVEAVLGARLCDAPPVSIVNKSESLGSDERDDNVLVFIALEKKLSCDLCIT